MTLQEAIDEAQRQRDILMIADPYERATAISDYLRREFPFAWQIETMQNAAARAVGVPTNAELERMAEKAEPDLETEGVMVLLDKHAPEEIWTWHDAWMYSAQWTLGVGALLLPFWDKAWQLLLGAGGFWLLGFRFNRGRHEKKT